ncbi:hypothetical protein N7471_009937, partial [Penicillium samsonianum]|uniref:uncharacterized protein n=1 Tax=Penicillium samsonianum TaxID=1882272 RepID=UPI002546FB17
CTLGGGVPVEICKQCRDGPRCEALNRPTTTNTEDSPPRLSRPKRTTKPPNNYAREQEIDSEQRKTSSQPRKKPQTEPRAQRDTVTSDDCSTENEDLSAAKLVKELVKLRREIRRRDELHKEEFSAALAETLTDRPLTPQAHSDVCPQNRHYEILRPEDLLRWVEAFCSERTAIIQINGQVSEIQSLPQAGLPQGSPLSPILFLFFNADLV